MLELEEELQVVNNEEALRFLQFQASYKEGPKTTCSAEDVLTDYLLYGAANLSPSRKTSVEFALNYTTNPTNIDLSALKPADKKLVLIYEHFSRVPALIEEEVFLETEIGTVMAGYSPFIEYLYFLSTGEGIRDYISTYQVQGTSFCSEAAVSSQIINALVYGKIQGFPNKIVLDRLLSGYLNPIDRNHETDVNHRLMYYIENVLIGDPKSEMFVDENGNYYDPAFKTQLKRFLELAVMFDYYKRKPTGDLGIFKQARIMDKNNPYTINAYEYYKNSCASMGKNPPALDLAVKAFLQNDRKAYIDYLVKNGISYSSAAIETSLSAGVIFLENVLISDGSYPLNISQLKRSRIKDAKAILKFLYEKASI